LVRQVGSTFHAGNNVGTGKDYTLWARIDGVVKYERKGKTGRRISVYPLSAAEPTNTTEAAVADAAE